MSGASIRILTDSTADVPPDIARRLRITVVPAYIQIGLQSYRDVPWDSEAGPGLSRRAFYEQLPAMPVFPTTAVPPAYEFAAAYRRLAEEEHADTVIAIVVSALLSGMYNVARLAVQDAPHHLRVHVVDSGQVTMGLGWIVIAAAEAAAKGKSVEEILVLVEGMRRRVRVYAMLDTLDYLRRSGRVGWVRAMAAQVLHIKPLLEVVDGEVRDVGRVRSRRRAIERLLALLRSLGPLERLALLHTYPVDIEAFRERLGEFFPQEQIVTVPVTTIIGAHVGPGGLGLAAVRAN